LCDGFLLLFYNILILTLTNPFFVKKILSLEAVGFVDRAFTILYDDDLERQWTLRDEEGNRHVVTYNKNLQKPMLIGGWTKLGTYMNFTISTLFILDMSVILASTSLFFPVNANLCLLHVFLKELRQINPFSMD